jgi:hypothetical protein
MVPCPTAVVIIVMFIEHIVIYVLLTVPVPLITGNCLIAVFSPVAVSMSGGGKLPA